ncbi:carbon monoxide dehydrogenase subunit G [Ancylobacter sp. 3268]|uniref:CoxG family protein n=1 Tax=Ancylobacter sp. 3268 TaxID=2817752 RepID=UPI0028589267|nr:carbon monoxide dehydrogenase subunit G [Ancylobacter sp. 3268]MDR6951854.1 carbon monoxide dehydrogenase subunit G [Ancylobacter sp. 3268]
MEFSGSHRIAAPRAAVWAALNDPEVLRQCTPGCQEVVQVSPTEFTAKMVLKIGPMKVAFAGNVTLTELDPPASCRIVGEGQGGVAGFAKGSSLVRLDEEGEETVLTYRTEAKVGGKIAQLGARLIDGTVKKLTGEFFAAFAAVVVPVPQPAEGAAGEA